MDGGSGRLRVISQLRRIPRAGECWWCPLALIGSVVLFAAPVAAPIWWMWSAGGPLLHLIAAFMGAILALGLCYWGLWLLFAPLRKVLTGKWFEPPP
jgi:hypothetical protein